MNKPREKSTKNIYSIFLFISIIFFFLFHLLPYLNNPIPLGFDAGIYYYIIENYNDKKDYLINQQEPLLFYFAKIFKLIKIPTNLLIIFFQIVLSLILGISVFIFNQQTHNKDTAVIAFSLFLVSPVFLLFSFYSYLKNLLALTFFIFSIKSLEKRNYLFLIIFLFLIAITHIYSFIFVFISLLIFFIINKDKKILFSTIFVFLLSIIFYYDLIPIYLTSSLKIAKSSCYFLDIKNYFIFSFPSLLILIFSWRKLPKEKNFVYFIFLFIFVLILFQKFCYERLIVFFDLLLIVLLSYSLSKSKKIYFILIFLFYIILSFTISVNAKPVVDVIEYKGLEELKRLEAGDNCLLLIDSNLAPYSINFFKGKIIAPGLSYPFYDRWTKKEWTIFLSTKDFHVAKNLLLKYKNICKNIYIFVSYSSSFNLIKFHNLSLISTNYSIIYNYSF